MKSKINPADIIKLKCDNIHCVNDLWHISMESFSEFRNINSYLRSRKTGLQKQLMSEHQDEVSIRPDDNQPLTAEGMRVFGISIDSLGIDACHIIEDEIEKG